MQFAAPMSLQNLPPIPWADLLGAAAGTFLLGIVLISIAAFGKVREWLLTRTVDAVKFTSRLSLDTVRNNKVVEDTLKELLHRLGAMRACINQFHNGEVFLMASHSWKTTTTHEAVASGVTREIQNSGAILVSQIGDIVGPIVTGDSALTMGCEHVRPCTGSGCGNLSICQKNRHVFHYTAEKMDMGMSRFMLEQQGVHHLYVVNLVTKDSNGVFTTFGYLSLHFNFLTEERIAWLEQQMCAVCIDANRLQLLLTPGRK